MKFGRILSLCMVSGAGWLTGVLSGTEPLQISIRESVSLFEVTWPALERDPDGTERRPYFELQASADLKHWVPIGERQRLAETATQSTLAFPIVPQSQRSFYRVLRVEPVTQSRLAANAAEIFGYDEAFQARLREIGQPTPEEFAAAFPVEGQYLPQITWDPDTALFWPLFSADPAVVNRGKTPGTAGYRTTDYRLTERELRFLNRNGFVVSERMGTESFGESFYRLWHNDLPVFISTDSILHAWHRTYELILEETEEAFLLTALTRMLDGMAAQVTQAGSVASQGPLEASVKDADYFVAVARSLLLGMQAATVLNQDPRVTATLADIQAEQLKRVNDFLGHCRLVDFSQFKVRGHYTRSPALGRYFKAMMWLGRIDVPVAGGPFRRCAEEARMASARELGTAIVLWHLLETSGHMNLWREIDRVIQSFVGWSDCLTPTQLGGLLAGAQVKSLADIPDLATLERIQTNLVEGALGSQNIRSDAFFRPFETERATVLPQTFAILGQRFVPDSWVFSQTVYSSIGWEENGQLRRVNRRVPSALDAVFAALGNDQVVPEIVASIRGETVDPHRPHALQFRDAWPYQHNLMAARKVIDQQSPAAWTSNLYLEWLACLRELSAPTLTAEYPEAMRTRAWAMKTVNTQLASWTELRHDTILYAKQSYTEPGLCVYPAGFVEPRVSFWRKLSEMADGAARQIEGLEYDQFVVLSDGRSVNIYTSLRAIRTNQTAHLRRFAGTVKKLEHIAAKELAQQPLSGDELKFIDTLMEQKGGQPGCGDTSYYTGWYPNLFYRSPKHFDAFRFHRNFGSGAKAALVADVHTDLPSDLPPVDPGSVLHEATWGPNLLMVAIDNGPDRMVFAGPVASHFEFEVVGSITRLSDEEWQTLWNPAARSIEGVEPPPWTRSYLPAR